jgi:hypothetical protein
MTVCDDIIDIPLRIHDAGGGAICTTRGGGMHPTGGFEIEKNFKSR